MQFFRKLIRPFSQIHRTWYSLTYASSLLFLHKIPENLSDCSRLFSGLGIILKKNSEIPHTLSEYKLFSEGTAPIILDVEDERQKTEIKEEYDEFEGINLERGITGVFDIEDIVALLQKEKCEDIFVGKIPLECNYAVYMVIVNGRSTKHMIAMCNLIRKIYKKKVNKSSQIPHLEGKNCNIWKALDLGNIILHVFSKEGRKLYDLETLWSVGKEYDTLIQRKHSSSDDIITDYTRILASLSPNT